MALSIRKHVAFALLCLFLMQLAVVAVHTHEGNPVPRSANKSYVGEDRNNCPICYFVDNIPFFLTDASVSIAVAFLLLLYVLPRYEANLIRQCNQSIPSRAPPFAFI